MLKQLSRNCFKFIWLIESFCNIINVGIVTFDQFKASLLNKTINSYDFFIIYIFMHLADAFIQSDLQCIQAIHISVSTCVPWESNPQTLRC